MERVKFEFSNSDESLVPSKFKTFTCKVKTNPDLSNIDLNYNLTERFTAEDLKQDFERKIKDAQEIYLDTLHKAYEEFAQSYPAALKMDKILGTKEFIGRSPSKDSKDYAQSKVCPIYRCNAKTVKLKRHVETVHPELTQDACNYAIKVGSILSNNYKSRSKLTNGVKNNQKFKQNKYRCTSMVNRRVNFKECYFCSKLCKNISAHIAEVHKVSRSDGKFKLYLSESKVVPSCYIRVSNGIARKIPENEMSEISDVQKNELARQYNTNKTMKKLREDITQCNEQLSKCEDAQKEQVKNELINLNTEYKAIRYKDNRAYPENLKIWKDSFSKYTKETANSLNSEKIARAASDVIIMYWETIEDETLDIDFLLNGKKLNEMLILFKHRDNLGTDTKIKYISYYKSFLHFICKNPTSPECGELSNNDLCYRSAKISQLDKILSDYKNGLILKGKTERAEKIQRKKLKILNSGEIQEIGDRIAVDIDKILKDADNDQIKNYTLKESLKARNALIAAATFRLPRRSKEIMKLTIKEAKMAKSTIIENEEFFIVYVLQHKTNASGDPAPLVLNKIEYDALNIYMKSIRSKFTRDESENSPVFANIESRSAAKEISFSNATKILNSYQSSSGKALSTRVARISRTTEQRKTCPSQKDIERYATSLSHSVETSNRYYVSTDLEEAVIETVKRQLLLKKKVSFENFTYI